MRNEIKKKTKIDKIMIESFRFGILVFVQCPYCLFVHEYYHFGWKWCPIKMWFDAAMTIQ